MRPRQANLNEAGRAALLASIAFLNGRLEERATIDWALNLKPKDTIRRLALLHVIDSPDGRKIKEPWRSAWRLIEESWNSPSVHDHIATNEYQAQYRLRAGDRSGSLVELILEVVAPRLKVEPFNALYRCYREPPKRAQKVRDLFLATLTSSKIVDPAVLDLGSLTDSSFLVSLAHALDAAVLNGLDIARRIGWDGKRGLRQLGQLHRVYYMAPSERSPGEHEPDEFYRGIAPSVKLLHAAVSRLVEIDTGSALEFVRRWKATRSPVHLRLWAALSRDPRVTPAKDIGDSLLSLDDRHFWRLNDFPEIAELRAKRFSELEPRVQAVLTSRIRKRPPRKHWSRRFDANQVEDARLYWAVRELRRIEIAYATLPKRDKAWLEKRLPAFPGLVRMSRLDEGFPGSPKARWVPPNPEGKYDLIAGEERLKALEVALASSRNIWDGGPANRAWDWIKEDTNAILILADLESIPDGGTSFPRVWELFGWVHAPDGKQSDDAVQRDLRSECARVLSLLAILPEATVRQTIDGVSNWLSTWKKQVIELSDGLVAWFKLWPNAVEVENTLCQSEEKSRINAAERSSDGLESMNLDTLNTATGRLVDIFLAECPNLQRNPHPFSVDGTPRRMRDAIIASSGRSGLIARYCMIEGLPYFWRADQEWTQEYLIAPLIADNREARILWRAIAQSPHSPEVLKIIGIPMAERATDQRLPRETQGSLVSRIVAECLTAFREEREPAVPKDRIQQMIRALDDEVRAYGAETLKRFLRDATQSHKEGQIPPSSEDLFRAAAMPFLQQVWPQESSLTTPGVSQALAALPAAAQGGFAEAVHVVKRFLVPFQCWSMFEYGLYGEEDGKPKLSIIDDHAKAAAFLILLDLTIGTTEWSVIPDDLADALDQVRSAALDLADGQVFRRLAAAARRR